MYQSLSEVITICKQNMGLRDLPKPVTDEELRWRLEHSALKEFSQVYPYLFKCMMGETERMCKPYAGIPPKYMRGMCNIYEIPRAYYQDKTIMAVSNVDVNRPNGYNDMYVPQSGMNDPVAALMGMASIQMSASMSSVMTRALTWEFRAPNVLLVYNGWSGGTYQVELALSHDTSLSTIEPSASSVFLELCQYDLEEYIYMKLKRIQNLDLGIGTIDLKIDDFSGSGDKKKELIKDLTDTAAFDQMHIQFW